jgi:isochorismate synthase EntC
MYAIVYKNKVIVGPSEWSRAFFTNALKKIGIENTILPRTPFDIFPHRFNDDTVIHRVTVIRENFKPRTQYLRGPSFVINEQGVVATYEAVDTEIEFARGNFKEHAAYERRKKEQSGITVTVQNTKLFISTHKEKREEFANKAALMSETDTVNWKFNQQWLTLTKAELLDIAKAIETHVQSAFDWEKSISDQIDSAETAEELMAIEIVTSPANKPPIAGQ